MLIPCAHCRKRISKLTGEVNRARQAGSRLFCNRKCAGLARRKPKKPKEGIGLAQQHQCNHTPLYAAPQSATAPKDYDEHRILHDVLNQARATLLVSIKGTPADLQSSLGKLNFACKAHYDWRTEKIRSSDTGNKV